MSDDQKINVRVAIACGGTGGHLFPGLAVAEELRARGCRVSLLVSQKEIDRQAVATVTNMEVLSLPAVGLTRGGELTFLRRFAQSYRASRKAFAADLPRAVLAMGGFTSAPPVLAGRRAGTQTFLHESNAVPGRANRWLSWIVGTAFIGFPSAAGRLHCRRIRVTGTPVRPQFEPRPAAECRAALGLDPIQPVVLVMGGSQGASGINEMVLRSLPLLELQGAGWQWLHLAGAADQEKVRAGYSALGLNAVVHPFFGAMDLALGAASAAVSRAGASSLAEIAAMRVPSLLVPYPAATDNHQLYNARAFSECGAALVLQQSEATPEKFCSMLTALVMNASGRTRMGSALGRWHSPEAAQEIASMICDEMGRQGTVGRGASPFTASDLMERRAG